MTVLVKHLPQPLPPGEMDKPFRTSEHHWYLPFHSPDGTEEMVFAYPKRIPITQAIAHTQQILPSGWYFMDRNDPTYEQGATRQQVATWAETDLRRRWELMCNDPASDAEPSSHKARVALAAVPATVPLGHGDTHDSASSTETDGAAPTKTPKADAA